MQTNLMQCAAHFSFCSNAGSTHTSISQTQPLDMTLSTCTRLLWSTMARSVLSRTCPVKLLYGLGHRAAAQFQGLGNLLIAYNSFFQILRVLCHEVSCWTSSDQYERVRAIKPNLTHLLPIHIWDLVTLTSHMILGRENGYLGPIWKFSLRGVLTFVASGLDINGCVFN